MGQVGDAPRNPHGRVPSIRPGYYGKVGAGSGGLEPRHRVHLVLYLACTGGPQVAHRGCEIGVPGQRLYGAEIEAGAE